MNTLSMSDMETRVSWWVLFWGLAAFFLGQTGFFLTIPRPFFGIVVITILASLIICYHTNKRFHEFADRIPLKAIALFHVWRIFAGWIFLTSSGILSQTFIDNASYGDIIAGFLGLSVFLFGRTKLIFIIFNVLGSLDFLIAVGTGITLTILGDPQMNPIVQLPLIMIPLFGVPLSGFTHFISLKRLISMKDKKLLERLE